MAFSEMRYLFLSHLQLTSFARKLFIAEHFCEETYASTSWKVLIAFSINYT